jgi:hypothetical protein
MIPAHFRVTYDGPALASHEMDVRELAPALLAAGDLLDAATRVLNGERVKPQINVRASFKTGSFGIDFALATDWLLKVRDIFAADSASAVANALEILGALGLVAWQGRRGLVGALLWLRGRRIEKVEAVAGKVRLIVAGESLEIELAVLVLLHYTQAKRILDRLKRLALGRDLPDAGACARFDKATKHGEDMRHAQKLLAASVASVVGKNEERAVASLFSPGGTHAIKGEFAGSNDFEVLAFMVVLSQE